MQNENETLKLLLQQYNDCHLDILDIKANHLKPAKKLKEDLGQQIISFCLKNKFEKVVVDGQLVTVGPDEKITINGGESDPENKNEVIELLLTLGILENEQVNRFERLFVNANTLKSKAKQLPEYEKERLTEQGKASFFKTHKLTITKKK